MRRLGFILGLFGVLGSGCANNAIFELTLETPAVTDSRTNLVVEGRLGDDARFEDDWQQTQISGIQLATVPNTNTVSFEASGGGVKERLSVKVRWCEDERCTAPADGNAPELRYVFPRAFYTGVYTKITLEVPERPLVGNDDPPMQIDPCAIEGEGCVMGGGTSNCRGDQHFCEL